MRWSPKYVSPLISVPIDRMLHARMRTGHKLQVLISAMCVSHAELVCEQVKSMYPELRVDWVGTGDYGRTKEENERALTAFCPEKDQDGQRNPQLDVLVHVGMAGEGLDAIHVSEVVLLCNASICNRILQIIGRGARYLPGIECNVSFDSSSEFTAKKYVGQAIMDAMDLEPAKAEDKPPDPDDEDKWPPLDPPPEPEINIFNIELLNIDSGTEGVRLMADVVKTVNPSYVDFEGMKLDPSHPDWATMIELYRTMRKREATEHNERAVVEQWRDQVNNILYTLIGTIYVLLKKSGRQIDDRKEMRGRIRHTINSRKKKFLGSIDSSVTNDLELLKGHYGWCYALHRDLVERGSLPSWLQSL